MQRWGSPASGDTHTGGGACKQLPYGLRRGERATLMGLIQEEWGAWEQGRLCGVVTHVLKFGGLLGGKRDSGEGSSISKCLEE